MNETNYKEWIAQLPSLTKEQASELVTRVKLLSSGKVKPANGKQEFGDRLLQIICDVMRKNNVETPSPINLRKSAAYGQASGKLQDLQVFFELISKSKLVQDSILKEAVQLLYNDLLQWQGVAISSHTLLKQIHRIPATLNKNYPGYAASGMLTKIVKGS